MNLLDRLQQAWQSQCSKPIDVNPDQLLKTARYERLVQFCVDIGVILVFLCVGVLMLGAAFRDIQKDWPWLISSASVAWVVGYILFNRWRRRRDAAHYDEPLLAHGLILTIPALFSPFPTCVCQKLPPLSPLLLIKTLPWHLPSGLEPSARVSVSVLLHSALCKPLVAIPMLLARSRLR